MKEKVICRKCGKKRVNIGFGYCKKCAKEFMKKLKEIGEKNGRTSTD
jgi:predicted amidophosphoribosyltransferase